MKTLTFPISNGTFTASDVTVSGTNTSDTHNIYVAFTQANSGTVAIQYKVSGSNNWQPMGKVDLTDTEVATFKVSGIITDWRFVVANASGTGSIEVTDSEKLEDIHPLSFYGETGGMSPAEISANIIGPRKCVVVFGSSNGAGFGASTYSGDPSASNGWKSPATSWAGLLEVKVKSLDSEFEFYNRSISGTDTNDSVARFFSDVAPYRPSHVILCTAIGNEAYNVQTYLANTAKLISFCRQIGAQPILRGAYPKDGMTSDQYIKCITLNAVLNGFGLPVIDHFSVLDDGSGQWLDGATYSSDGTHLNDAGQRIFYDVIEPQIFLTESTPNEMQRVGGRLKSGVTSDRGFRVHEVTGMDKSIYSFAMRMKFKTSATPNDVSIGAFYGSVQYDGALIAINSSGNIAFYESDNTTLIYDTGFTVSASTEYDVVVSFNQAKEEVETFVNGASVGSFPMTQTNDMIAFTLCGKYNYTTKPPVGYEFYVADIFRCPKDENFASMVSTGKTAYGSIVYGADFGSLSGGQYMPNRIKGSVLPTIENNWEAFGY